MFVYLKRLRDWKTLGKASVMSFDAQVWSNDNQTGSMVLADTVTTEHVGAALLSEDGKNAWIIKSVKPQDDGISLSIVDFINAFDRPVVYTEPVSGGSMRFIRDVLNNEFNNCPDDEYKVKLTAAGDASTDFMKPEILEGNLFNPADYIRELIKSGIRMTINYAPEQLVSTAPLIRFTSPKKRYNLPFDDGKTQLIGIEISKNTVAKVTSVVGETMTNYYLQADGSVGTTAPSPRIAGEWRMLVPNDNDDIMVQVKNVFANNSESHQIEFYSERELEWGGVISCAVQKQFYTAQISSVSISSSDGRYRYKAGDLPRTLTEKLSALNKPVKLGALDATGVLRVSQGGTGQSVKSGSFPLTWNTGSSGTVSSGSGKREYYPYLGMCFVRSSVNTSVKFVTGSEYVVGTVGSAYKPSAIHALSVRALGGILDARISADGEILVTAHSDIAAGYTIYISGFWFMS